MANLNVLNVNIEVQWPMDAVETLIILRRHYQYLFSDGSIRDHTFIWGRIAAVIQRNDG